MLYVQTKIFGCIFTISTNYPISPKIHTIIPEEAIIGDYRYIYLLFNAPQQNLKTFYLEAYDTSNGETIISNGDCYLIDITKNSDYELRIYKELKSNSFVQFRFFGLPQNFTMQVRIQFKLNMGLFINDEDLGKSNSLYKNEQTALIKYIKNIIKN